MSAQFQYDGHLYSTLFEGFKEPIDQIFGSGYGAMIAYISGPLGLGLTIYIGLLGYAVLRGAVQFPMRELLYRGACLALLYSLVTSQYGSLVAQNFYQAIPSEISTALGGGSVNGSGQYFDEMLGRAFNAMNEMFEKADETFKQHAEEREAAGSGGVGSAILGAVGLDFSIEDLRDAILISFALVATMLLAIACTALGFTMVIYTQFALVIILTLGPIFVAALLFDSTRGWFNSWMNQVVNHVFLFVIINMVTTIITTVGENAANLAGERETPLAMAMVMTGYYAVGLFLYFQVPGISAGIAGGAAAGASSFASSVFGSGSKLLRKLAPRKGGGGSGPPPRPTLPRPKGGKIQPG